MLSSKLGDDEEESEDDEDEEEGEGVSQFVGASFKKFSWNSIRASCFVFLNVEHKA